MQFAEIVKQLMDDRGLTNYQLAKDLDIHPTTVANWLDGKEPRKKTFIQLANYFGVTVDYLSGKAEKEKPVTIESDELKEREDYLISIFNMLPPDKQKTLEEIALTLLHMQ